MGTTTGLVRSGTGTTASPYVVDLKVCANNELLKYNGSTWNCVTQNSLYQFSITDGATSEVINNTNTLTFSGI